MVDFDTVDCRHFMPSVIFSICKGAARLHSRRVVVPWEEGLNQDSLCSDESREEELSSARKRIAEVLSGEADPGDDGRCKPLLESSSETAGEDKIHR